MSNAQAAAAKAVTAANKAANATATAANALANAGAAAPVVAAANQTAQVAAVNAANAAQVAAANAGAEAIQKANEVVNNAAEPLLANVPAELADAVAPPDDSQVEHLFANTIKFGKFAILAVLLVVSFINGHKEYISENPRKFMWDNFAVGLTSAIAISIIAFMRGRADLIPNLAFISFFLFFTYNVFRELSGLNAASDAEKQTAGEAKQMRMFKKPLLAVMLIAFLVMAALAFKAKVAHPLGMGRLALEALIFALAAVVGEIVVAVNHGETKAGVAVTAFINFILFFCGHILLQYGGFYNHVFGASGPSHDPIEEALHED